MLINGEEIKGKRLGEVCRKVGVVLQNVDEQIIQKTVEDEIAFGCENLAFSPEKISKQIDTVCRLMKLRKVVAKPQTFGRAEAKTDHRFHACDGTEDRHSG